MKRLRGHEKSIRKFAAGIALAFTMLLMFDAASATPGHLAFSRSQCQYRTAPSVSFGSTPQSTNYSSNSAVFTYSANQTGSTYLCSQDGVTYGTCTGTTTLTGLSNGSQNFYVKAKNCNGQTSSVLNYSWTQNFWNTVALYHFDNAVTDSSNYAPQTLTELNAGGVTTDQTTGFFSDARNFPYSGNLTLGLFGPTPGGNWNSSNFHTTMTIEAWVYINDSAVGSGNFLEPVAAQTSATSGQMGWEFGFKAQKELYFAGSLNGTSSTTIPGNTITINPATWYHIAMTYNNGAVNFYFGQAGTGTGSNVGSGTIGTGAIFSNNLPLTVGYNITTTGTSQGFIALLDKNTSGTGVYVDELRVSQTIRYTGSTYTIPTTAFTAD